MALTLVTASAPLVTTAEAKRHCRIDDFNDDDSYIESLISVAQAYIDGPEPAWLGRSFGSSWTLTLDSFPSGCIRLPLPPLQEVTEVAYTATDGTTGTVTDFREFGVESVNSHGFILPAYDAAWPDTRDEPEAVRITFTAGYATVPPQVKHAILLLVGEWYENREDAGELKLTEIPTAASALLMPLRFWPS
jgi:uncharacterized phiE125 gp8 family phage protein